MPAADPRRWWALGALALAMLTLGFDMTILNVALATISRELDAGTSELQWIVDSYVLVFAALLLPTGLLGDRFGRKRMLLLGLAVFGAASVGGALADTPAGVIAARVAMGLGAAVMLPLSMSILPTIFSSEERTRAIAVWTGSMALGLPLGPLLGGWLLEHFRWGSIFVINVPVVVVAMAAIALLVPESRDPARPALDLPGALLSITGLAALVYGVIEGPVSGWDHPGVLIALAAGAVLLANLVVWESRAPQPMMNLALFRDRRFVWSAAVTAAANLMMAGILFVLPQYLQVVLGNDAFGTGLRLIPMLLGLMVGAVLTDRLAARTGHKPIMVAGMAVLGTGFALGALTGATGGYSYAALWLTVLGAGLGLTMVPAMDLVISLLPGGEAGRDSGLVQTLRQTGSALGIAMLGSLLSQLYRARVETDGLPGEAAGAARDSVAGAAAVAQRLGDDALLASAREAFVFGMNGLLAACAGVTAVMAVPVLAFLPGRRADRDAAASGDGRQSSHAHAAD